MINLLYELQIDSLVLKRWYDKIWWYKMYKKEIKD